MCSYPLERVPIEPGIAHDKRPEPRPGHILPAAQKRLPELSEAGRPQEPPSREPAVAKPLLAQPAQRSAHPRLERQHESLLGPVNDRVGQETAECFHEEPLRRAV